MGYDKLYKLRPLNLYITCLIKGRECRGHLRGGADLFAIAIKFVLTSVIGFSF